MDDFLKSNDSEKYLLTLLQELIEILSNFSFSLTKWLSNSNIIMSSLAQSELSSKFKVFVLDFRSIGFFEFLLARSKVIDSRFLEEKIKLERFTY